MKMVQDRLFQCCVLIVCIGSTLASTESNDQVTKQKRSTTDLEYVIRVLEEQGRLGEVDDELLSRIQSTINNDKAQNKLQRKSKHRFGLTQESSSPRESVLSLARARQIQLFGTRRSPVPEPRRNSLLSERKQVVGGECQALKTENNILKQQLLAVQSQQQQLEPRRNIQLLNNIQVK